MEKISGIISASPRVLAVDAKEMSPVRPGTPSFGRPEGVSTLKNSMIASSGPRSAAAQVDVATWKAKDSAQATIVSKLSENFFIKPVKPEPMEQEANPMRETETPNRTANLMVRNQASTPAGFKTDEVGSFRAGARPSDIIAEFDAEDTTLAQPEGLYPKGSFIDRAA